MDTELERILADDYLADLPDRSLPELRAIRGECQRDASTSWAVSCTDVARAATPTT